VVVAKEIILYIAASLSLLTGEQQGANVIAERL